MQPALSERGQAVWMETQAKARESRAPEVDTGHLLLALSAHQIGIARQALDELGATREVVQAAAPERELAAADEASERVALAPDIRAVLSTVMHHAPWLGPRHVEPHHFLLALAEHPESVGAQMLVGLGISAGEVRSAISRLQLPRTPRSI